MGRFRTTTLFVEGRDRPERRRRVYGAPRLVALAIGLPVLILWFAIANTGLAVMPILQGIVVWLALSLYTCYVLSDDLFGSIDSITVDTAATGPGAEGAAPVMRFRTRLPFGRTLLLWAAVSCTVAGGLLAVVALADLDRTMRTLAFERAEADRLWAGVGIGGGLLGIALLGVWIVLLRVPPGLALSPAGLSFRRGLGEEHRGWGEIRDVEWSGGAGRRGRLSIDFSGDRPLRRGSISLGSNAELVGRLAEFYRGHAEFRKVLDDLDRALDTFEMHH